MLETELAYTAGIIDGEGTIVIEKAREKRRNHGSPIRYRMHCTVLIRERDLCVWLQSKYGGSVYKARRDVLKPNHSECWLWRVTGKTAAEFLSTVKPYLKLKHLQAENAVQFQSNITPKRRNPLTEEELAIRETHRIIQQDLNHKGSE